MALYPIISKFTAGLKSIFSLGEALAQEIRVKSETHTSNTLENIPSSSCQEEGSCLRKIMAEYF